MPGHGTRGKGSSRISSPVEKPTAPGTVCRASAACVAAPTGSISGSRRITPFASVPASAIGRPMSTNEKAKNHAT